VGLGWDAHRTAELDERQHAARRPAQAARMTTMAGMALGFERLSAILGPCAHLHAVPVELLLTGELVAWLCPGCGRQLPAGWAAVS
jgi:hypothetical protein